MCVIIYRKSGHDLKRDTIQNCMINNPDGWGIMYHQTGRIEVERGLETWEFWNAYNRIEIDREIAIHFRWRTHGDIDLSNTHPYPVLTGQQDGFDLVLMHNGIIDLKFDLPDERMSDTWHWIRDVVRPTLGLAPCLLDTAAYRFLLEQTIGGSRVLFLDQNGNFTFLSQDDWYEIEGCLFSNQYSHQEQFSGMYGKATWNDNRYDEVWTPSMLRRRIEDEALIGVRDGDSEYPSNLGWSRRRAQDMLDNSFHLLDYQDIEQLVFHHQDVVVDWFIGCGYEREFDLTTTDDLYEVADFIHLKALAIRGEVEEARRLADGMLLQLSQDRTTRP